ncbi:protein kinase domain-containing protein [Candidatus Uabimicrobium amorphum]|uniref:Protein kinase domain-containing protein n=1 Tax=Uabimicrobium amorphum TaxID=2596890 RepID=A0A5S9F7W5_UABAM|nr:hypothetical protein [Candidatus Uabimicrobium amorphum]BBM88084.1 hypothetical protein UABAM_06500 [Candidatus Uabimicrobium amorphum]
MKFSPGQTIDGHLYFNKNRSNIAVKVKVIELLFAGEHFHYYKALNCNGDHVCIKVIRYRSEGRNIFSSAMDYVVYRRKMLLNEHRILAISHPSIPEPLAMITIENNCDDDEKLFHKFPDWQQLKTEELILVQEYLAGSPLPQLQDQIQLFSIKQRLSIFYKLIKLFSFVHEKGFVIQNLHPEHIIMNPEHNDNINIVGLHYSCPLKSLENTAKYKKALFLSGQKVPTQYRPDVRSDVQQLGIILHYLLTLDNPSSNDRVDLNVTKKAVEQLSSHHSWVLKLLEQLLCNSIHKRLHSVNCIASYLNNPPQQDIDFDIVKASRSQLEIKITHAPNWSKNLEFRIEDHDKGTITENKIAFSRTLLIPGKWGGEITCGIRATSGSSFTWWKYKNALTAQKFPLSEIPDLPTDQVGFEWPPMPNLKNVSFFLEENNRLTKLCDAQEKVILPVDGQPLPYNKKIKIICQPNFLRQEQNPMQIMQEVYLVPTINVPVVYNKLNQIFFEIVLSSEQQKIISQIELLHNGVPYRTQIKEDFIQQIHNEKIVFKLNKRNLLMFEKHVFSCRILLDSIGWKKGPNWQVDISPPGIQSLAIEEPKLGTLQLSWRSYPNKYLRDYGIFYNGEEIAKTTENNYQLQLDNATISREMGNSATIEVISYYEQDGIVKKSQPYAKEYLFPTIENILRCNIKRSISPKSVTFELDFKHFHIVQDFFYIYFYREANNETSLISKSILREKMSLKDEKVSPGKTYKYFAEVEGVKYKIFDETPEIPQIGITFSLEKVGYETCSWLIRIDEKTLQCMDENIEIQRLGQQQKTHKFMWDKRKTSLQFTDKYLIPGEEFEYYLYLYLENEERYEYFLGNITTKKFDLDVDVNTTYNCANISWKPSPQNRIDCIQLYDHSNKFLAATKSDSITLENLEPEREYVFPLKYKYLSGHIQQGTAIKFKTKPYKMEAETTDFTTDSFRLKWDITDTAFAMKLVKLYLKVSANVGEHELSHETRSVQLKQLLPCTTYHWTIHGQFKSGRRCLLASGDATTETPKLNVEIEVGLIHHIKWSYKKIPAISKIEVHRNDLPLIETDEDELYDSDFKGGKEITYRFFYVMSDGRKLLATEKKVQSLSMKDLFSAIKIQPKTGAIYWDFSELKRYTFFQSVELFLNNKSLFHQENTDGSLIFEDWGQSVKAGKTIGLPEKSMNFELAVVGIAPIKRKCKKKWTLSIKGIKCYYSNLPYQFNVFREYSTIYFQWEKMPTELLEEVVLERLSDNRVIYSGINEEVYIVDDNDGYGLESHTSYQYIMKLKYKNHQTLKKIEVLLEDFDEDRLNIIEEQISDSTLQISWDSELDTSITHIGWGKSLQSFVPKFLKRYHFVDFAQGKINIPIQPQDMSYELVYKDCYNNIFYGVRRHMPKELIK